MNDEKLKAQIYEPILKTWQLLKSIQHLKGRGDTPERDAELSQRWETWINDCDSFCSEIDNPEIKSAVDRFLIDMGTAIAHINDAT